tara:strand:+ start:72 stop:218 length:147 start_codon:yes stop_codon:yes gene_type:complete
MNSNWGLVDPLPRRVKNKKEKRKILAQRAQDDFIAWIKDHFPGMTASA